MACGASEVTHLRAVGQVESAQLRALCTECANARVSHFKKIPGVQRGEVGALCECIHAHIAHSRAERDVDVDEVDARFRNGLDGRICQVCKSTDVETRESSTLCDECDDGSLGEQSVVEHRHVQCGELLASPCACAMACGVTVAGVKCIQITYLVATRHVERREVDASRQRDDRRLSQLEALRHVDR